MGGKGSNELFVRSGGSVIRPRLAAALNLAAVGNGLRILDIGCGRGEVIIKCAQAGTRLAVGVDYAPVSVTSARRNVERMGLRIDSEESPVALGCVNAKALPFKEDTFDRVFMLDIVEHLHEWELQRVWQEVRRVLKADGVLVVHTLPNRWAVDCGYKLARMIVRSLPASPPDMRDAFHVNEQTLSV
jgi:cyclopropane fatty-acyl-phospholipid synthase-like methyltransferase